MKKQVMIMLSEKVNEQLRTYAFHKKRFKSDVVEEALIKYMVQVKPESPVKMGESDKHGNKKS